MITFITDDNKKGGSPSDDEPEIGFTEKGRSVGKIIEDAEAQKQAEENVKVEEKENNEEQSEASENNKPENAEVEKKIDHLVNSVFSIDENNTKFYKGNLRNGMSLEFDGSIVILGDVNPGAQVKAKGNILILGALKGIAHAGCEGEKDAFVFALSLIPVQLRIGNIITRFPDGDSKVNRKPEYAYVEDGKIYVSSFD